VTASHYNTLQHAATHCNTLQYQPHSKGQELCKWGREVTATYCNTLEYTATHCNTLQHTATHCMTLEHTATSAAFKKATILEVRDGGNCNTLQHTTTQHTATPCNIRQHAAIHYTISRMCCTVLKCVAVCCSALLCVAATSLTTGLQGGKTPVSEWVRCLQHTAINCNTRQQTATYCNKLQHPASSAAFKEQKSCK